jgi:methylmalonyl-CoA mutase N-terminal domain/subunit
MNVFRDEEEVAEIEIFKQAPDMQAKRIEYVINYKKNPDRGPVRKALNDLAERVKKHPDKDLVVPILEAVEAKATLQEISDAMREAVGFSIPQ